MTTSAGGYGLFFEAEDIEKALSKVERLGEALPAGGEFVHGFPEAFEAVAGGVGDDVEKLGGDVDAEVDIVERMVYGRIDHDCRGAAEDVLSANVRRVGEGGGLVEIPLDLVPVLQKFFDELVYGIDHADLPGLI